jgi:hypothetical protein
MTTTVMPPSREVLTECVRLATAAPSLHNSQPWLFRIGSAGIDVYADRNRRLPVLDPEGREQLISVGAAVFTLRLGMRRAGYLPKAVLFPRPDVPDLVAGVAAAASEPPNAAAEALAEAVPHRHTNRWPFAQAPVPPEALERLRDAARREFAVLTVANAPSRDAILELARTADHRLRDRSGYLDELSRWTGRPGRHDGVPSWATGPWDALEGIPVRDFAAYVPRPRPRRCSRPGARVPPERGVHLSPDPVPALSDQSRTSGMSSRCSTTYASWRASCASHQALRSAAPRGSRLALLMASITRW